MPMFFPPQKLLVFNRVVKTLTTSRVGTTLSVDPHLQVPVLKSQRYELKAILLVQGITSDSIIEVGWTYPSGTTIKWTFDAINEAAAGLTNTVQRRKYEEGVTAVALCDSDQDAWYEMKGIAEIGGTSGTIGVRWGQDATDDATRVLLDSEIQSTLYAA